MSGIKYSKIIFPEPTSESEYIQIQNVNLWRKWSKTFDYKLKLAIKTGFNNYFYYNYFGLKDSVITKCFTKACQYSNIEIINEMINRGFNNWEEGLYGACKGGSIEMIDLMVNKIQDECFTLNKKYNIIKIWNTGMAAACKAGRLNIVKMMIGMGANDFKLGVRYASKGSSKLNVEILLEIIDLMTISNANNNDSPIDYWNCSEYACKKGHLEIVKLIINHGIVNYECGLFYAAFRENNTEIIDLIIQNGVDNEFIHRAFANACEKGNIINAKFLLKKGADINRGMHIAFEKNNPVIIQFLIDNNANDWNWGLSGACEGGHLQLIQLLIDYGANNWNKGMVGACHGRKIDIVKLMINKGANDWNRGLVAACGSKCLNIVNLMIEKGANDWNEGLEAACCRGDIKAVQLMIEKGADNFYRGLAFAKRNRYPKIIKLLEDEICKQNYLYFNKLYSKLDM